MTMIRGLVVLLAVLRNCHAAPSGHALVFDGGGTDIAAVGADLASVFSGTGGGVSTTFWMKMYYLTDGSARAFPMTMQTDMYGNLLQPWYYNAAAGLGAFILDSSQSNLVGVEEDGKHGPLVNTTAAGPIDVHDWHHYGLSFDPGPPGTANFTIDGALVSSWTAYQDSVSFADVTAAELGGAWMHLGVYTLGRALQKPIDAFRGALDDVRLWTRALSPAELAADHAGTAPAGAALSYAMDEGAGATVANGGTAGAAYNLRLGQNVLGGSFFAAPDGTEYEYSAPAFLRLDGAAPSDDPPLTAATGPVCTWPLGSLTREAVNTSVLLLEDEPVTITLLGEDPRGERVSAVVSKVPDATYGTLYQQLPFTCCYPLATGAVIAAGDAVTNEDAAIVFVPAADFSQSGAATLEYYVVDAAGQASPPVEVVFNVVALDDLPIISAPPPVVTTEDTEVSISIEVSDAEGDFTALVLTATPSKGKLYVADVNGEKGSEVSSTFNQYEVPVVLEQYAKDVLAVSSFWAGSHKWHPYQALGEQDVFAYGDSPLTWCPAKRTVMIKGQLLDATLSGADDAVREVNGAVGQLSYEWNPATSWTTADPPYTEFIELKFNTSVYPSLIEIGENRGMGSVVAVRARLEADAKCAAGNSSCAEEYLPLYEGAADADVEAYHAQNKLYRTFRPSLCAYPRKVDVIRLELDTITVDDWNEIDYVKLVGSEEMMSGVIGVETSVTPFGPWSGTKSTIDLIYEPASSYFGNDSFSLQAYDCPWLQDRVSESLTVTIEVTNVPDAPTASDKSRQVDVDTVESIAIYGSDSDPFDELTFLLRSLPTHATLTMSDGKALPAAAADGTIALSSTEDDRRRLQQKGSSGGGGNSDQRKVSLKLYSEVCGDDSFTFAVTDGTYTSEDATVSIEVVCPAACTFQTDMTFDDGGCDVATLRRTMTWRWLNASNPVDANATANLTTCDLPRAPELPDAVEIFCDYASWSSPLAVALGIVSVVLALTKLALLAYTIVYRAAPVFRKAQVSFCAMTIVGGVMADLAPLTLLGPISTFRCHLFPSWLLLATTLLYGPLVLKTYRVWKILDNPSLRNVRINVRQLSAYLIGYLAVELILIIVLGFTSPVHAEVYPYAFSDYASFPRTRCQGGSSAFTVVAYVFVALPCVVGLFLAFKTRNVSGEYTENKPILAAFYTLALAALVVTPISSVFGDQDLVFHLLIVSLAILVVSSVSVFAFMLPKLLYHRGVLKKVAAHGSGQHGSHTSDGHTSAHASEAGRVGDERRRYRLETSRAR